MEKKYVIGIDQSTQGTKVMLFDETAKVVSRVDMQHEQIINDAGWVSHNPEEIYQNVVQLVKKVVEDNQIAQESIAGIGISNQRETSVLWDRETGKLMELAVVWQCARAEEICEKKELKDHAELIRQHTGLPLSPYFPAAKIAWMLEHVEGAKEKAQNHTVCHGTIDSWLVFKLTKGKAYKTDYSNASRTQLFNIMELTWDNEICGLFGIDPENLPEVTDSDCCFGETTLEGYFEKAIPIHSVMGDSHAALYGQGCHEKGMIKTTYGTGSSIMMNIGSKPVLSSHGVVTSLAWGRNGTVDYVLEGNLNYTGAVIRWMQEDMGLFSSPGETELIAENAAKHDGLYLVPAFTGLGAPYWDSNARAAVVGMSRTTGKNEFIRSGLECIAYQIADIVQAMEEDSEVSVEEMRVDGGPTRNRYLMQFQSDILNATVQVPEAEELSCMGAAYMAGITSGLWNEEIFKNTSRTPYYSVMENEVRQSKRAGWKQAVNRVLTNK